MWRLAHWTRLSRILFPILLSTLIITACGAKSTTSTTAGGSTVQKPSKPVKLQILDVGGYGTTLADAIIKQFAAANPDQVASVDFPDRIPAPQLSGKLKAQQDSGKVVTSLVLSGFDGVASSIKDGTVEQILPKYQTSFANLNAIYQPTAKQYNDLAQGYGLVFTFTPSGPLFEFDPSKVASPPKTIDDLKAWILANPGKFEYAQPRNSGPGRTMLMGLPYLLGDSDPSDPDKGWDKTWQFLQDINGSVPPYASGTGATMKDLGNGTVSMVASTYGWDINPKVLKNVPATDQTVMLTGTTQVADAGFLLMPKGLDSDTQIVVVNLMQYFYTKASQAMLYDQGYFYPGPAIQGVTIDQAPQASQDTLKQYGNPNYDAQIAANKVVLPLTPDKLSFAFDKWDRLIGSTHK